MNTTDHNCQDHRTLHHATEADPYHYTGSGLPNVYLVGVTFHRCELCGNEAADIPALPDLLTALAGAVVNKESELSGAELRFLRKRLQTSAVEFAGILATTPETLSRMENGRTAVQPGVAKLTRLIYVALSGDDHVDAEAIARWSAELQHGSADGERIIATRDTHNHWMVNVAA